MADLGIEGDLEFSIEVKDDGSVAVKGAGAHSEEIEAAINADPSLQKLMRNSYMSAKFGYELPVMKEAMDAMRAAGDEPVGRELFAAARAARDRVDARSEEHTSELQSLMRISYAVFCLKKKNTTRMTHDADSMQHHSNNEYRTRQT